MTFSIIIPVHNAMDRIDTIINRLVNQTFKDFETIYVCDKCDDDSFSYIAQNHKDAIVIETNHGNDGLARSTGLDVAKGKWVMFIDDDDDWNSNNVLETVYKLLKRVGEPHVDVLCCGFNWKGIGEQKATTQDGGVWTNVWSKVWKRAAIGDTRFPNVYPDADTKFVVKMFEKPNLKYVLWDYVFYDYNYMRKGSISWKERKHEQRESN